MDWVEVSRVRRLFAAGKARRMREDAHLSVRELAEMVGADHSSLSRWETGKTVPSPDAAIAWAKAMKRLGVNSP